MSDALPRRSGVGSGTIIEIKAKATQPCVAVLKKVLDGVPMDLNTVRLRNVSGRQSSLPRE